MSVNDPGRSQPQPYTTVIMRQPAPSAVDGETSVDLGMPDFDLLRDQHRRYADTVRDIGIDVVELEPLGAFPDAYFVEDVAVICPEVGVLMRSGAQSRRDESIHIREALSSFRKLEQISEPGTMDGGDVLVVGKHCIVGLSERTNRHGADQLRGILEPYGYRTDVVDGSDALHFKSCANFLDNGTLLVTSDCTGLGCIADYEHIVVPEGEEYAANVVWLNGQILVPEGFPRTLEVLQAHGYLTKVLPVSEIAKMDGGLTCLSLRLN